MGAYACAGLLRRRRRRGSTRRSATRRTIGPMITRPVVARLGFSCQFAVSVFGWSIVKLTHAVALDTPPVQPVKTHVVFRSMTSVDVTPTVAVDPCLYQPTPATTPWALMTVSSYSWTQIATTPF